MTLLFPLWLCSKPNWTRTSTFTPWARLCSTRKKRSSSTFRTQEISGFCFTWPPTGRRRAQQPAWSLRSFVETTEIEKSKRIVELNAELQQEIEKRKKSQETLENFVCLTSHELKSPLTAFRFLCKKTWVALEEPMPTNLNSCSRKSMEWTASSTPCSFAIEPGKRNHRLL